MAADLSDLLGKIEKLENEILQKCSSTVKPGEDFTSMCLFMFGAMKRTLSQAKGFRDLVATRNFPCAAGILRMQIDTAMRINGLMLLADPEAGCREVLGGKKFSHLEDRDGKKLLDFYLKEKLSQDHPWIKKVYDSTSDFIHLSGRHFYNSVVSLDEESRTMYFQISGIDNKRPDEEYHEIVNAFFEATKIAGLLMTGYFRARQIQHARGQPESDRQA